MQGHVHYEVIVSDCILQKHWAVIDRKIINNRESEKQNGSRPVFRSLRGRRETLTSTLWFLLWGLSSLPARILSTV